MKLIFPRPILRRDTVPFLPSPHESTTVKHSTETEYYIHGVHKERSRNGPAWHNTELSVEISDASGPKIYVHWLVFLSGSTSLVVWARQSRGSEDGSHQPLQN